MLYGFRRWHWRAFLTGGGSAFWLLAYGIIYWALRLSLDSFTSTVLYMGYLLLLALFDFLITGTSPILSSVVRALPTRGTNHLPSVVQCVRVAGLLTHVCPPPSTGTIGFLATYWAVRRLYSAIRVD